METKTKPPRKVVMAIRVEPSVNAKLDKLAKITGASKSKLAAAMLAEAVS